MEASFASELSWAVSSMSSARILQQLRQVGASDNQLQTIREKFVRIQNCVEVHSRSTEGVMQPSGLNRWLKDVNDLIFYVEDTINEHMSEDNRRKTRSFKRTSLFSLPTRMSYRVRKILSLLDKLDKESSTLGLTRLEVSQVDRIDSNTSDQVLDSLVPESVFESRNIKEIIDTLAESKASDNGIFTIAIVGMAGIGKSTLAKRVYTDTKIKQHYGNKMFWVKVGENFDATKILKDMFRSLPADNPQSMPEQTPQSMPEEPLSSSEYKAAIKTKLHDFMKGENSLLVLDDVLCVNEEQLQKLYALHSGGGKISILVTIRRIEAARSLVDPKIHHVKRLTVEESWDLFKSLALKQMPIEEGSELESIGMKIAGKCYGIPRVISKMADSLGRLGNVDDVREWEKEKAETELWELILSTLSLKFNSLPKALRQCLAYCSIFPKNATIGKLDLISLWIAQGFVTEEATAEKYFNILLNKSLLQVCTQDEDGNVLDCTMQELAYDLAVNFSRHDRMLIIADGNHDIQPGSLSDVRHLVMSPPNGEAERVRVPPSRRRCRLRTIYLMVQEVPMNLLSQARSLYVLKLDGIGLKEVPRDLAKLKYLRYLDLSNNQITSLPESITQLYLLQTLRLINCINLSPLSEGLSNFINNLPNAEIPPKLCSKSGTSTAQRKLDPVYLNAEGASKQLSNLGRHADTAGVLCISGLEYVKFKEAAQEARIGSKSKLSSLELSWRSSEQLSETIDSANDEKVLDGLQPHPNIRRLKLTNYDSQKFPEWVMRPMKGDDNERLNSLVRIELVNCKRCQSLPSMGELPCLQELIIDGMSNVDYIGQELYYHADDTEEKDVLKVFFPALTRLELRDLDILREWQPSHMIQAFTRLNTLQVVNCPNLTSIPTDFPRIKNLLIQGVQVNVREHNWLDAIITKSSSRHTLISLVLSKVSGSARLPKELFQCTSLKQLRLQKCEKLKSWPGNPWNPISLEELCIDRCSSLTYSPNARSLNALKTLVIRGCRSLKVAPKFLERCTSLTKLAISNCVILKKVENLQYLISLEELDIIDCKNIESLPPGINSLTSLRTMRIGGESGDISNWYRQFPECTSLRSLEKVWLKGMKFMDSLPQQLRQLSQLKVLRLKSFTSLKKLPDWLCNDLINLELLIFEECNYLSELPSQEKLMQLRKLHCLRIEKCNILKRSYNKEGGIKWKDISHIPHIKFDNVWHQGDRSSILQENPINTRVVEQRTGQPAIDHQEHEHHIDEEYIQDAPCNDNDAGILNNYFLGFFLLHYLIVSLLVYWATYKQC
ncbi:putative disease resistance protein RGA4 [Chenopodium quinoa]|uniref:Uncharacterized protein n=1 Tax=Chenopodium quinoa TaxID=63459 RepID=A0A803N3A6_CHEQI|nr:putative disease resistance protein RGA4 [Chenopodium quinoa]